MFLLIKLVKLIVWLVGLGVVIYFGMRYFGYDVNWQYFKESRQECEDRVRKCREEFFAKGYENPECKFNCLDASGLIIKKK